MSIDKRIKIAYLLEYPLDLPGGAQMSTESLCRGLCERGGFKPVVICPHLLSKGAEDYPFDIVTYDMGKSRIGNLLTRIFAFRKLISAQKPDIVHIQMPESLITFGMALIRTSKGTFSGKRQGVHLLFTDRGLFYGYRKHSLTLMKMALKKADMMLTTTDFNRGMWLDGTNIRPIEKVANTISDKFLTYDSSKRIPHRSGTPIVLGLAGRICEEKNWPFAVKLIGLMAEAGIDMEVRLVLSVFEEGDDKKVSDIISGISAAIGSDRLIYRQDLSQSEMSEYYYGVDIFMMTSQFESFGKAAVEAMSRKCAVISTAVGGLPEVIGNPDNLYTVETAQRAVDYVRRASLDEKFLADEQEYFYKRYIDNFSQDRCLADHIAIYNRILNRGTKNESL